MDARNRILRLLDPAAAVNGIAYVEVREPEPARVYVHFFNRVAVAAPGIVVSIFGGDVMPVVPVTPPGAGAWSADGEGRPLLALDVAGRGDHSAYTLSITGAPTLDPYFAQAQFSFYAFCPSPIDCRLPAEPCPAPDDAVPVIDYLAKDFESFRGALSDFSRQRYPDWRERAGADLGVVVMEALSAIGDELSYIQDRGHLQAKIGSATERDAIVSLARLVDYEPTPVRSARTLLQCNVGGRALVPAGVLVTALAPDGSPVPFAIGAGIRDAGSYLVDEIWNAGIAPYWWDDADRCLPAGATAVDVAGHGFAFTSGQQLLVDTAGETPADAHERQVVAVVTAEELLDPVYGRLVTRISWRADDALAVARDLTRTRLAGNLLPATQGVAHTELFAISETRGGVPAVAPAVARLGANSSAAAPNWTYRHTLNAHPLAYLPGSGDMPQPEVLVRKIGAQPRRWTWVRSLLEAGEFEEKFTIDAGVWRPVGRPGGRTAFDYDGDDGATLRFGDGVFGVRPLDDDVFEVQYRESRGRLGNVPADAVTGVDAAWAHVLMAVTNPFAATGGADAETVEQIRQGAPAAFRAVTHRAVRAEDYSAIATRLPWVQRAGTVFRWTGSWHSIFVTADPKGSGTTTRHQRVSLSELLNRTRLAGYEVHATLPVYVSFDLEITVCAAATAFRGDVYSGIDERLRPVRRSDGRTGYFHFDNFTFGMPFERSRLEAALQQVPGVAGVLSIRYRRRGLHNSFRELGLIEPFGPGEIFRMDNDPNHPERGSYRLMVQGGR
jgi:hypothetical protein